MRVATSKLVLIIIMMMLIIIMITSATVTTTTRKEWKSRKVCNVTDIETERGRRGGALQRTSRQS